MLLTNARIATMSGDRPYGLIDHGALAIKSGAIAWVGSQKDLPSEFSGWEQRDQNGRLVTPGLIDCHTHLVFGGNRAEEFEARLEGVSYQEIARRGGGIVSTVKATRSASQDQLEHDALKRLDHLIAEGVTTVEIKSGYGLDIETELKMLRVARRLEILRPIKVTTSFLGAHAVPAEYSGRSDDYVDDVAIPALLATHDAGLVDAVDGFCETIAFTPELIRRVFEVAHSLSLPVKLHAEQLSNLGGAVLAAKYSALSADHLEYLDEIGISAMAKSNTVAVLLPGAFYTLRESQKPPIELLRSHGVPIALATDCNPGSSPLSSLLMALNMGCTLFELTPEEVLSGVTRNAAKALGMTDRGMLKKGLRADLCIWDVEHPAELAYRIGFNPLKSRLFDGAWA